MLSTPATGHLDAKALSLASIYQRPILSVAEVQALTGTTNTAANSLVSRLVKFGILQEATGNKRSRGFRYQPYLAIFGDDVPANTPIAVA